MKPLVAVIHGSPRRNRNSDAVAEAFLKPLHEAGWDVEHIRVSEIDVRPCIGCEQCHRTGICFHRDSMDEVCETLDRAKWLVLVSPVYFNSVTGTLKLLIDRCQVYYARKFILGCPPVMENRLGALLMSAGIRQTQETLIGSIRVADYFFKAQTVEFSGSVCLDQTDCCDPEHRADILDEASALCRRMLAESL